MEATARQKIKYGDKPIIFKGKLLINGDDVDHLMYRLQNTVIIKP